MGSGPGRSSGTVLLAGVAQSTNCASEEALPKILDSCCYGAATTNKGGTGMANVLVGKTLKTTSGAAIRSTATPHRLERRGYGRCILQFKARCCCWWRGEKVRFAVAKSQIPLFRDHLAWPLNEVIDREEF